MMTPEELRRNCLKKEYEKMLPLNDSGIISWDAVKGTAPYVEKYLVTAKVSGLDENKRIKGRWQFFVELGEHYPYSSPRIYLKDQHSWNPNVYSSGSICVFGKTYSAAQSLAEIVILAVKILAYKTDKIGVSSPANREARDWYLEKKAHSPGDFPVDKRDLDFLDDLAAKGTCSDPRAKAMKPKLIHRPSYNPLRFP